MKFQRIEARAAAWVTVVAASALVAFGCTSTVDTGQGGGAAKATLDDACGTWAKSACNQQSRCDAYEFVVQWKDATDCEARLGLSCKQYYEVDGATATASDVEACAASFAGACDASASTSACALKGTRAVGAGCSSDAQCSAGRCWIDYSCLTAEHPGVVVPTCGVCLTPKTLGEHCELGQCGDGLFCDEQGACAPMARVGGSCSTDGACPSSGRRAASRGCAPSTHRLATDAALPPIPGN